MRCHKCLERGHTRALCPGEADRSGRCYRCGEAGHTSRGCRSAPKCPLCTDRGRPAAHVLGANTCIQRNVRGRPPGAQGKAPVTATSPLAEAQPAKEEKGEPNGGLDEVPKPQRQSRQEARKGGAPDVEAMEVEAPSDGGDKAQ
ncbi:PREDICTED: serine/arginine-rich splicing factor RS2Z32-like [Vollenhovia emeryi]|uniref:serine/arginine-rich splicing factor RS2Z32-like n=1 Tax=Vollenhovia emeryi TaxID=411798 RepID=UPI0005F4FDCF|nr:PREDICTED: serine/arginine-rich splicing factor RS2Z32-like [Vollenhovia emeryi]